MNQKCKVCGEPAAGFHFGAFTCEGCKSFFGRTYSNVSAIGECKNGGQCVINKKNRTSCKACRLRKCLLVGMSKSGSRYGRRSNWFKIHCLLQEQTGLEAPLGAGGLGGGGSHADLSMFHHQRGHHHAGSSSSSPEGINDVVKGEPGHHHGNNKNMSSSSSVASGRSDSPMDDNDDSAASKENLRVLLTASPSDSFSMFQHNNKRANSSKAGLLAIAGSPFASMQHHHHSSGSLLVDPVRTSSPKLPGEGGSGRKALIHPPSHHLYHLFSRQHHHPYRQHVNSSPPPQDFRRSPATSVSPVESLPEQDGPIDLSCKASSSSSSPLGHHQESLCHIRAEILTGMDDDDDEDDHLVMERDGETGTPLDLTTKG